MVPKIMIIYLQRRVSNVPAMRVSTAKAASFISMKTINSSRAAR